MASRRLDSGDPDVDLREVRTDRLTLVFVPTVGGRLISLAVDGVELLWRDRERMDAAFRLLVPHAEWPRPDGSFTSWVNLGGSKTWPAPQGWEGPDQWAGPPDGVLDAGVWSYAERASGDDLVVSMTSGDDPRTGLRVTREFSIPSLGLRFEQLIRFQNVSDRVVRWSPWEVCQVDTVSANSGGEVEVSITPGSPVVDLGVYHGDLDERRLVDTVVYPVQDVVAKRGFPGATGSIRWRAPGGEGVALEFEPDPEAEYPDRGSRAELWLQAPTEAPLEGLDGLHPRSHLAELEVVGPLRALAPGEQTELRIGWSVSARR